MSTHAGPHGHARIVWLSTLCGLAMMTQHVGGKAMRDGLFLSQFSVAELPTAMLLSAILSVPTVLGVSWGMRRFGPGNVAPAAFASSAALFALEWVLLPRAPRLTAGLVYLHVATLGGTVISAFWSIMSERFDPHSAKLALARVTNGVALGGLIGGLLVSQAARAWDGRALLLSLAVINLVCAVGVVRAGAGLVDSTLQTTPALRLSSPFSVLNQSSYLRMLSVLVLLTGFVSALLDFSFKARASATLASGPALVELFALFHTATAVLTALVQTAFSRRALERLGLAGTLAVLPASVLLTGALGVSVQKLWSSALLRGVSSVLESSLFRSAYEPLYTPLSPAARRSSKTLIDVGVGRLGEALGSGSALLLVWLLWRHADVLVMALAMAAAAGLLLVALRLHAAYVAELTTSLRNGSISLHEGDVVDSTTRLTLSQTQAEISRSELLAQLAALRANMPAASAADAQPPTAKPLTAVPPKAAMPPAAAPGRREPTGPPPAADRDLLSAAADLLSGEAERVQRLLVRGPLDRRLLGFAIPLLQQRELVLPITSALNRIAPIAIGQLVDALNDPTLSPLVRQRLPRVIKGYPHVRAVHGLMDALRAPERPVRHRAAIALGELSARDPKLTPERDFVFQVVRDELSASDAADFDLHHVFSILGLAIEREGLMLARNALTSDDARQRGTALEYLQNVLPEPLRSELLARLEPRVSRPPPPTEA